AGIIRDLPWKKTAVSLARREKVPLVPVHISGQLSERFYRVASWRKILGIPWNLEMMLLVDELFRLRNTTLTITIGEAIPASHLDASRTDLEWTQWLYQKVYQLPKTA
ncbi:MAG: glycerol acyltransferase, partial [Bacteroidota bacterium]